jgi:hypothetical protein
MYSRFYFPAVRAKGAVATYNQGVALLKPMTQGLCAPAGPYLVAHLYSICARFKGLFRYSQLILERRWVCV